MPTTNTQVWRIDRDELDGRDVCVWGTPTGCYTRSQRADVPHIDASTAIRFRLLDDDGEPYYSGVMTPELYAGTSVLAPLDDYGTPNAGCTTLQVFTHDGWTNV